MSNEEVLKALSAPFPPELVRERQGHGNTKLRWVPARSVAERLDQALGVNGWDFAVEPVGETSTVVGILTVRFPDGTTARRQDFGYETGGSGESLKEAASDALRRCASLFGVARYLYQGTELAAPVGMADPRIAAAAARIFDSKPAQAAAKVKTDRYKGSDPEPKGEVATISEEEALRGAMALADGECPTHRTPWVLKPAGVSKTGKEYAAFWSCGAKDGYGWCKNKPSLAWLGVNPPAAAEQQIVKREDDLADLSFPPTDTNISGDDIPF